MASASRPAVARRKGMARHRTGEPSGTRVNPSWLRAVRLVAARVGVRPWTPPGSGVGVLEEKIKTTIEAIRPAIQADGGDIYFRGVDEATGVVQVELVGACVSCPASTVTLKAGIERI